MSIWGSLLGGVIGFSLGGPFGALLGSFLGGKFQILAHQILLEANKIHNKFLLYR